MQDVRRTCGGAEGKNDHYVVENVAYRDVGEDITRDGSAIPCLRELSR